MHYDYYQQRFLQLAEQSVDLGRVQALALGGIGASMAWLMSEMSELRHTHTAALALQQAILQRDVLQEKLEEFIYQSRKMISSFLDPADQSSPVSKALLIRSFFLSVKGAGISTSMIRGIPNKEAFDNCLDQAKALYRQLGQRSDVRKAIAEEEAAEKRRIENEAKRQAEEEARRIEEAKRNAPGMVTVSRTATATGGMYGVQIAVDGEVMGEIGGAEYLQLRLRPGTHVIAVSGGGMSRSLRLTVSPNDEVNLETYFSNWGILGGGLNLKQV